MKLNKKLGLLFITLFLFQILVNIDIYMKNSKESSDYDNNGISPLSSAIEDYLLEYPSIDTTYFSPQSSPGALDEITISFIGKIDFDYTVNVRALPRPLNQPTIQDPYFVMADDTGKSFMFGKQLLFTSTGMGQAIIMATSYDNGTNWSEFSNITNYFSATNTLFLRSPVSVYHDGVLHLVFGYGTNRIHYMNSSDLGVTWGTPIQIPYDFPFSPQNNIRISMAVNHYDGVIHIVTDLSNSLGSGSQLYLFNTTNNGESFSMPIIFPQLSGDLRFPSLDFNSAGTAYLMAYVAESINDMRLFEFTSGFWNTFNLGTPPANGWALDALVTVDDTTDVVKILTAETTANNRIFIVNSVIGDVYTLDSLFSINYMNYANTRINLIDGTLYFSDFGLFGGNQGLFFEKYKEAIELRTMVGSKPAYEKSAITWDGKTDGSLFTNYTFFDVWMTISNATESTNGNYRYSVTRDDIRPSIKNIHTNTPFISPAVEDGNFDELITTFTTTEEIEYSYSILSEIPSEIATTKVTSSTFEKRKPKIVKDFRGNYYAFYIKYVNTKSQLLYHKSTDGGSTWEKAVEVTKNGDDANSYDVCSDKSAVYILSQDALPDQKGYLRKSYDGGNSWSLTEMDSEFFGYPTLIEASREGVLYSVKSSGGLKIITNSTDGGKNWNDMYSFGTTNIAELKYDNNNDNLYILSYYSGLINTSYIHIPSNKLSENNTVCDYSGLPFYRSSPTSMTIIPSENPNGDSTIEVYTITPWGDDGMFDMEKWTSGNNGTGIWTNSSLGSTTGWETNSYQYYDAITKTSLLIKTEDEVGVDVLYVSGNSTIVSSDFGWASNNIEVNIEFDGKNTNNSYVDDGLYKCFLAFWDNTYNVNTTSFTFIVDNILPNVTEGPITFPEYPSPTEEVNITFTANDTYITDVYVKYRHLTESVWSEAALEYIGGDREYNATIPGDSESNELRYYIEVHDMAGNIYIDNNDGVYYGWSDVSIEYSPVEITISQSDISTYIQIPMKIQFTSGIENVKNVTISTDAGIPNILMTLNSSTDTFNGTIPIVLDVDTLNYQVSYFDLYDIEHVIYSSSYSRPTISATIKANGVSSSINTEFSSYDDILFDVIINEGLDYIDQVNITIHPNDKTPYNLSLILTNNIYSIDFTAPENNNGYSFSISIIDIAGRNILLMGDTPMIKPTIQEPLLEIEGISDNKITTSGLITLEVSLSGNSIDYIVSVEVLYSIDGGDWIRVVLNETLNIFNGTIGPFANAQNLTYKFIYTDIVGNELESEISDVQIIPSMPALNIAPNYFMFIGIISAVVGLVVGSGYIFAVQRQTRDPRDIFIENFKVTREMGKQKSYNVINDPALNYEAKNGSKGFNIMLIVSYIASIGGLVYFIISAKFEYATLIATGIALLTVVLFNHNMTNSIQKAVKEPEKFKKTYATAFLFLILLGISLAVIFYVGSFIDWFNYYVNEQTTSIGSMEIPSLWISIGSTFASTLLIVVFSTLNAVKRLIKRLEDYARNGITSRNLYAIREEQLQALLRRFLLKLLMFVVIVGAAIISTTNLNTYSSVGLVVLLPFLGGLLLLIMIFGYSRKNVSLSKSIINNKIKCPSCEEIVPEGMYCQLCGNSLIAEQTLDENVIECKVCNTFNPRGYKFCRICGNQPKK